MAVDLHLAPDPESSAGQALSVEAAARQACDTVGEAVGVGVGAGVGAGVGVGAAVGAARYRM